MSLTLSEPRTLAHAIDSSNGFNLVRLVAAMLVFIYHCFSLNTAQPIPDPISKLLAPHTHLGAVAVSVFFMISGLFITRSWMRDPHPLRFFARRIARIVPGLFVCLALTTMLAVAFFSGAGWKGIFAPAPWRYVFGSSMLHWLQYVIPSDELRIPGVLNGQDINGPLWTLYWEGRMYVMLALLGASAVLPMRLWLMGMSLFLMVAAGLWPQVLNGYIWEVQMCSLFLVGMLLYTLAPIVRVGLVHVVCAFILAALSWTRSMDTTSSGLTLFGITLIFATAALWAGMARFQGQAHIQRNDYSFGIYIYHWPIILMLRAALPPMGALTLFATSALAVIPLAMLSWHWIESPALNYVRKKLHRGNREPVDERPTCSDLQSKTVRPAFSGFFDQN